MTVLKYLGRRRRRKKIQYIVHISSFFRVSKQDGKSFSSKKKELKLFPKIFRAPKAPEKIQYIVHISSFFKVSKQDGKQF